MSRKARTTDEAPKPAVTEAAMTPADAGAAQAEPPAEPPAPPVEPPPPPAPVEPLEQLLRRVDTQKAADGITAVRVTHPDATSRVWPGVNSGIRTEPGPVSVLWSDGSTE